jgi:hypothetical protein
MQDKPNVREIKSRRMRLAGLAARVGEMRNTQIFLARKPERKRPL